ncbi:MAG: hypothetical protein KJ600_03345 [Nanoarchaeota archaeon]|nr:hypothetical protein [Nanoarchaeota archaeon]MBU1103563.1 hypothetical protein [Nanoarchaeota archaeon]
MNKGDIAFGGLVSLVVGMIGLSCAGFCFDGVRDRKTREHLPEVAQVARRAVAKSAGSDRIWTTAEKRNFVDQLGYEGAILQECQDVYFRPYCRDVSEAMFSTEPTFDAGVEIVLGYNLENNGSVLVGSSSRSGTVVGRTSEKDLWAYVIE